MAKRDNHLRWIAEPLTEERSYIEKPMFGALACYLNGRLVLALSDREPPWNGLLLPTEKQFHASLMRDFKALSPHPVLGKWLFLPQTADDFEATAPDIVEAILAADPRIGVEPKPRKKPRKKSRP